MKFIYSRFDVRCIFLAGIIATMLTAISVRRRYRQHKVGNFVLRNIFSRDLIYRMRISVIREITDDDPRTARISPCDSQCQFIRFAAGAAEHCDIEFVRKLRSQALRVIEHVVMQVPGVCVKRLDLFLQCFDNMWMAVPDVWHVVIHVEILISVRVEQPDSLAFHKVHGIVVEKAVSGAQQFTATRDQRGRIRVLCDFRHLRRLVFFVDPSGDDSGNKQEQAHEK